MAEETITEREAYLLMQALVLAIEVLNRQPYRQNANIADMRALLEKMEVTTELLNVLQQESLVYLQRITGKEDDPPPRARFA
jgi:hypothetical protein